MPSPYWTHSAWILFIDCAVALGSAQILGAQQSTRTAPVGLTQLVADIARRADSPVLVEPGLILKSELRPPAQSLPSDKALSSVASQVRDGGWVRVAVRSTPGGRLPSTGKLAQLVRNLRTAGSILVIENVTKGKAMLLLPSEPAPKESSTERLDRLYLLYRTRLPLGEREESEFSDLQAEHLSLIEGLSPANTPNPMLAWAGALQGLHQDEMMRIVGPMAQAGDSLWKSTPPDQRASILSDSMKVAKTYGGGIEGLALGSPPSAPPRDEKSPPRNYLPELRAKAAALSTQLGIKVLVEPGLFVAQRPEAVDQSLALAEALDRMLASNKDISWRRIILPSETVLPPPGELAAQVRLWESANLDELLLDAGSPRTGRVAKAVTCEGIREVISRVGDHPQTIYLIYGTTDHRSKPASARLKDLLQSQMEQLVRMSPEEITSMMMNAIQDYQNAGSMQREKLMALPVMAGMMATWFPQAAKEGTLKP